MLARQGQWGTPGIPAPAAGAQVCTTKHWFASYSDSSEYRDGFLIEGTSHGRP